jgi:hypothetical protein
MLAFLHQFMFRVYELQNGLFQSIFIQVQNTLIVSFKIHFCLIKAIICFNLTYHQLCAAAFVSFDQPSSDMFEGIHSTL